MGQFRTLGQDRGRIRIQNAGAFCSETVALIMFAKVPKYNVFLTILKRTDVIFYTS